MEVVAESPLKLLASFRSDTHLANSAGLYAIENFHSEHLLFKLSSAHAFSWWKRRNCKIVLKQVFVTAVRER